jgi:TolA-binding protein
LKARPARFFQSFWPNGEPKEPRETKMPLMSRAITRTIASMAALFALGWLLLTVDGCAYYNTFYNAKKQFRTGEGANRNLREGQSRDVQNYKKCIETGARLLELYPKSRWVDNCLLLMGKAYYRTSEYPQAQRKFEELISNFPRSKLIPEARLWLAETLVQMNRPNEALPILEQLLASSEAKAFRARGAFLLGNIHFNAERYGDAADAYRLAAQKYRKKVPRSESLYMLGRCLFLRKEFEEARATFERIPKLNPPRDLIYLALVEAGRCTAELGDTEGALDLLGRLKKDIRFQDYSSGIDFTLANIVASQADYDEATRLYRDYIRSNPGNEGAAEAFFRLGFIYRDHYRDLPTSAAYFDSAKGVGTGKLADSAGVEVQELKRGLAYFRQKADMETQIQFVDSVLKRSPPNEEGSLLVPSEPVAPESARVNSMTEVRQDSSRQIKVEHDSLGGSSALPEGTLPTEPSNPAASDSVLPPSENQTRKDSLETKSGARKETPKNPPPSGGVQLTMEDLLTAKGDLQRTLFHIAEFYLYDLNDVDSAFCYFERAAQDTFDLSTRWRANLMLAQMAAQRGAGDEVIRQYYETALATEGIPIQAENRAREALGLPLKSLPRDTLWEKYLNIEKGIFDAAASPDSLLVALDLLMTADPQLPYYPKVLFAKAYLCEHRLGNKDLTKAVYRRLISLYPDSAFSAMLTERLDTTKYAAASQEGLLPTSPTGEGEAAEGGQEPGWPPPEESLLGRRGR